MHTRTMLYRSGTDTIDITQPGGVDRLLNFHRATFGDARMENEGGDGSGTGGSGESGSEAEQGGSANDGKFKDPDTGETYDFPEDTPTADMNEAQKAEYWRHKARKHESRYRAIGDVDKLRSDSAELARIKREGLSDTDKALADAREEGANEARAEERGKYATQLVAAEFRAANAGRLDGAKIQGVLEGIDPSKFLTSEGQVATDKVQQYVDGIAPADTKKWPDMGQGRRGGGASKSTGSGVAAGKDLYEDRHPQKS